jgi:hypothetical protein
MSGLNKMLNIGYRKKALVVVVSLFIIFMVMLNFPSVPDKPILFVLSMYYGVVAIVLVALWDRISEESDLLDEDH